VVYHVTTDSNLFFASTRISMAFTCQ
jgi:hypothetical protein